MKLTDYLTNYENHETEKRLQELIDEQKRLLQVVSLWKNTQGFDDTLNHRQFLLWNVACADYFSHHKAVFVGFEDYFSSSGTVPALPTLTKIVGEIDILLIQSIQTELKERGAKLTEAKKIVLESDKPNIKITKTTVSVLAEPSKTMKLGGKKSEMISVLKRNQDKSIPMSDLAKSLSYATTAERKVSDLKSQINTEFSTVTGLDIKLIDTIPRKGYLLNTRELNFV